MKRRNFLVCLASAALALGGCGRPAPASSPAASGEAGSASYAGTDEPYPVTITNYACAGNEVSYTSQQAPRRVVAVDQGAIETMSALGLEEHVVACYGLDNPVKEEWQAGLAQMNYQQEAFAPDRETVT